MNAYSNTVSDWSKYLGSASGFLELFAHNLAKRIHNMSVSDTVCLERVLFLTGPGAFHAAQTVFANADVRHYHPLITSVPFSRPHIVGSGRNTERHPPI